MMVSCCRLNEASDRKYAQYFGCCTSSDYNSFYCRGLLYELTCKRNTH